MIVFFGAIFVQFLKPLSQITPFQKCFFKINFTFLTTKDKYFYLILGTNVLNFLKIPALFLCFDKIISRIISC
jgi:hypothetical protein